MAPKVSAVLITYKRPLEIEAIINHLKGFDFINEILVRDQANGKNLITYGRYITALKAKNEFIYVQDDDCIVHNIRQMYELFTSSRLINAMKKECMSRYSGRDSLVGWGAFLNKNWPKCLNRYIEQYGEDNILYREADRIFTSLLLNEMPRHTVLADVTDFPSAMSRDSLSLYPLHEYYKKIALARIEEILKYALVAA